MKDGDVDHPAVDADVVYVGVVAARSDVETRMIAFEETREESRSSFKLGSSSQFRKSHMFTILSALD